MESSMWSAGQSQWLITHNSLSHRHTEVPPLEPSPVRSPWRLAVSLATTGGPPLPTPSSAQLVAPLKSNDLFRHHLHSHCLLITTTNAMWIVLVLSVALAAWLSGCCSSNFQCTTIRHRMNHRKAVTLFVFLKCIVKYTRITTPHDALDWQTS